MQAPARPIRIAVIGERQASARLAGAAEIIGREIARRGGVLVCGGMGGVMEAASRGAAGAGGIVVGILPTNTASEGNPYVTLPVPTGMGEARNVIIVRTADAIIAVGGAYGTLSEIGHALNLGVPIIGLDTWSVARSGSGDDDPLPRATTPQEAVAWAWAAAEERRRAGGSPSPGPTR